MLLRYKQRIAALNIIKNTKNMNGIEKFTTEKIK